MGMTIREYFKNYKKNKTLDVKLPTGNDATIGQFYDNCLAKTILPKDNAIAWHNMFMEYVKRDDAIFWVRYYESGNKNSGRWNTRRACKTEFADGFSYVFVSNYDVHEIFNMVRMGVTPDIEEFIEMMKCYEFPLHYDSGRSCEETDAVAFPKIGSIRGGILTPEHWYLAHIVGVKSTYFNKHGNVINVDVDKIYPRGVISDWKPDLSGRSIRKLDYALDSDEKDLVRAHFLRFVDPLNYYAAPGKNYQTNDVSYNIGEATALNEYMGFKYSEIYTNQVMSDFLKAAFAKDVTTCDGLEVINVSYGIRIAFSDGSRLKKTGDSKKRSTSDEAYKLIAYYLRNNDGLEKVEEEILHKNSSGAKAKRWLNNHGVDTSSGSAHKGLLKRNSIDDEISKASGIFKETLEEIKKRGL